MDISDGTAVWNSRVNQVLMPKFRREIFIVTKLGEIGIFRMHERMICEN